MNMKTVVIFHFETYSKNIEPMINTLEKNIQLKNIVLKIQQIKKKNYFLN